MYLLHTIPLPSACQDAGKYYAPVQLAVATYPKTLEGPQGLWGIVPLVVGSITKQKNYIVNILAEVL